MGKININYTNGSIGGVLPSTDFISSFLFDSAVLPAGFDSSNRVKAIYSLQDAVDLGITNTSIGETVGTGNDIAITTVGAVGDYIKVYAQPANHAKVLLGTYTVKTGDAIADVCEGLTSNINLNTSTTAWISTTVGSPGTSISLTPPAGLGASVNGADIITTESKTGTTFAVTITPFSTGAGSDIDLMYYTIDTFFKTNPTAKVWLGIYDFTSAYDPSKIAAMQTRAGGEIRQMGIFLNKGLESVATNIPLTQAVATDQGAKHKPLSIVLALQPGTATEAGDLLSIRGLSSSNVTVTLGNEYGTDARGYNLKGITSKYPTDLGVVVGHMSRSKVSHSIAWVERNPTIFGDIMIITGEEWLDIEDSVVPQEIFNKGYVFERKYLGYSGSYFDNAAVADSFISDYDSIQRRRTIDKAGRIAYNTLLPMLSSPVILDAKTGQLSTNSIVNFVSILNTQFDTMQNSGEVSGYGVYIDPSQNLLATKNLQVTISIVPVGSADEITVNLGFALAIS